MLAPPVSGRLCSGGGAVAKAIVGAGKTHSSLVALQEVLNESRHLVDAADVRPLACWAFALCQQVLSNIPASKLRCDFQPLCS